MLVISGRNSDFIHAKDGRFNPARRDHALAGHPKLLEAAGFGVKGADGQDEIWLAFVARASIDEAELRQFCEEKLGNHAPRHFLVVNKLPRNEGGKIVLLVLNKFFAWVVGAVSIWALLRIALSHSLS